MCPRRPLSAGTPSAGHDGSKCVTVKCSAGAVCGRIQNEAKHRRDINNIHFSLMKLSSRRPQKSRWKRASSPTAYARETVSVLMAHFSSGQNKYFVVLLKPKHHCEPLKTFIVFFFLCVMCFLDVLNSNSDL